MCTAERLHQAYVLCRVKQAMRKIMQKHCLHIGRLRWKHHCNFINTKVDIQGPALLTTCGSCSSCQSGHRRTAPHCLSMSARQGPLRHALT